MKLSAKWFAAPALLAAFLAAAQDGGPGDYVVSRDVPEWFKPSFMDFPEDVAEAAENGRRVMVYFGQDGCPYCKKLHETAFKDEEISRLLKEKFDSVAVNIFGDVETVWTDGEEGSEKEMSARLGVQFTPTLLFLDEDGGVVAKVYGYRPPEWLKTALAFVAEKKEKDGIPFDIYMHENAHAAAGEKPPAASLPPPAGDLHAPGRRTMIFVSQNNCKMCEEWRKYLNKHSARLGKDFRMVALNRFGKEAAAKDADESEWARRMKITFAPALVFVGEDGGEIFRAEAYLRPFHLESVIAYVKAGAAKNEPEFQRFLQNRADQIREDGGEVSVW